MDVDEVAGPTGPCFGSVGLDRVDRFHKRPHYGGLERAVSAVQIVSSSHRRVRTEDFSLATETSGLSSTWTTPSPMTVMSYPR